MRKLILIRHGETDKNKSGVMHKTSDEAGLNKNGRDQIGKTAETLRKYNLSKIFYSTELRAVQSAEIIAQKLSLETQEIDRLQERNWGVHSGKSWQEVSKILEKFSFEERYNWIPEGGESWKQFEDRLLDAIQNIRSQVQKNEDIVVVSHGGAIRALIPALLNIDKQESYKYDPDNASVSVFEIRDSGYKKVKINSVGHL